MSTARPLRHRTTTDHGLARLADAATVSLAATDPQLYGLLDADIAAQENTLSLRASASLAPPSVLACAASAITNVSTCGYPGHRLDPASDVADAVEELAVDRAMAAFDADGANVQPHSSSAANLAVYLGLLEPGDTVLGLDAAWGGPRAHASPMAVTGKNYNAVSYGLNGVGRIDYDRLRQIARRCRPKLIVCSVGAYPRIPEFPRFRAIADEVGAYLLADMTQVAGLVAARAHPNPVHHAHVTTCCTSMVGGPPGGLILLGRDADTPVPAANTTLRRRLNAAVYPLTQGAPHLAAIAGKARALHHAMTPQFRQMSQRAVANAKVLAARLLDAGHDVLTNGTDNHMVLVNVMSEGMTGLVAERALAECGIHAGRSRVPFDIKPAQVGSGIRLGAQVPAMRGMAPRDMEYVATFVHDVLNCVLPRSDTEFVLDETTRGRVHRDVAELCHRFPFVKYSHPANNSRGKLAAA